MSNEHQADNTRDEDEGQNVPRTPIADHQREGKTFKPPLATIPELQASSWIDDWLPELVWAALLIEVLGREHALDLVRRVVRAIIDWDVDDTSGDLTFTGISTIHPDLRRQIIEQLTDEPPAQQALRPLLLFEDLPAFEDWMAGIDQEPDPSDWQTLGNSIASTLFHQSKRQLTVVGCASLV